MIGSSNLYFKETCRSNITDTLEPVSIDSKVTLILLSLNGPEIIVVSN